jgi:hypothetical protein
MNRVTIDKDFRDRHRPLSKEEMSGLKASLELHGCLDPLKVWKFNGQYILLDGHNRHDICIDLGIDFDTVNVFLDNREDALDWIDRHQLDRRNLDPGEISLIRGRIYNRAKKKHGGDRKSDEARPKSKGHSDPLIGQSTASKVAAELNVSEKTIKRDGQFADAVETLKEVVPDIEEKVADVPKAAIVAAAKVVQEEQESDAKPSAVKRKVKAVLNGTKRVSKPSVTIYRIMADGSREKVCNAKLDVPSGTYFIERTDT